MRQLITPEILARFAINAADSQEEKVMTHWVYVTSREVGAFAWMCPTEFAQVTKDAPKTDNGFGGVSYGFASHEEAKPLLDLLFRKGLLNTSFPASS
jgi:hypothetical protein